MGHDRQEDAIFGVGPSMALMVGEWYLHSRSAHRDAQVIEAYRQLQVETDHLFTLLTRDARQRAVRVTLHSGLARFALATELYGVNAARSIAGEAPDLRALLLAPSTPSSARTVSFRPDFQVAGETTRALIAQRGAVTPVDWIGTSAISPMRNCGESTRACDGYSTWTDPLQIG
jgi:hypothetical protein